METSVIELALEPVFTKTRAQESVQSVLGRLLGENYLSLEVCHNIRKLLVPIARKCISELSDSERATVNRAIGIRNQEIISMAAAGKFPGIALSKKLRDAVARKNRRSTSITNPGAIAWLVIDGMFQKREALA